MDAVRWFQVVVGLVGVGAAALFTVQNSARTVQLSFDLVVWAGQLKQPVPVVALLWGALVVGFLAGALPVALRASRLSSRVRELESQQALAQAGSKEPGAW